MQMHLPVSGWFRGSSGIPSVRAWIVVALGMALIGTSVPAGARVHGELGDAPDLIPGQMTNGFGPLLRIHGSIRDSEDVDI